ncbi:MAG: cyclic nucleotide-binding domain-containing protein [Deltaproteobacteria bacterium]|nr:cyclic nucleotide-binding domain-containing protein [Candidatus Zymogenaceae bacterium]
MYLIQSRTAAVVSRDTGGQTLISRLLPSDFFGEVALLTGMLRTADVVTETDLRIMEVARDNFKNAARDYPEIVETLKKYVRTHL